MKLSVILGILHGSGRRDEPRMRVSLSKKELKAMTGCKSAQDAKDAGWRGALLGDSFGFHHVGMVKSENNTDGSFCIDIDYVRIRNPKSVKITAEKYGIVRYGWKHKPGCNIFIPVSKLGLRAVKQNPISREPEEYKLKKSFRLEIPMEWFKKTTKPPAAAGVFTSTAQRKGETTQFNPAKTFPHLAPSLTAGANAALAKSVRAFNKATATWAKANAGNPNNLLRSTIQNGKLVVSVTTTTKIL